MGAEFHALLRRAKLRLLRMHYDAGVGHIGGNLSALHAMLYLHHHIMQPGDRFVLAKGHAAGALYVTLWTLGQLGESELQTFHRDGTRLAGHPPANALEGVTVATGSLGHGLPIAAGMALARRLRGAAGRIFCLMSDGEWQEGSNWEALIFANHHRLSNLVTLVDMNGLQGFGRTEDIASLGELSARVAGFGVSTVDIDGHCGAALGRAVAADAPGPHFVFMKTIKGKGVSFMENRMEWHYLPMNEKQYGVACAEVESS